MGGPRSARVVAVVVTYHPDLEQVTRLMRILEPQVDAIVVVDNGSSVACLEALRRLANSTVVLLPQGQNLGIAAAQNLGITAARDLHATHVLLSDDDSQPEPDLVERLLAAFADATDARVAAVGPVTVDPRTGTAPLVFTDQRTGPRRIPRLPTEPGSQVEVAFLIASGCLIDMRALDDVGLMNADLFIDHVDLEWGVRARRAGWRLRVVVGATLVHSLGDETRHVPGRDRDVHLQSPVRNYFTVRNTVYLIRSGLFVAHWRRGYRRWITRYIGYYLLAVPPRARRVRLMAAGLRDGLRGRLGPLPLELRD